MTTRETGLNHAPRINKKYLPLLAGIVWSIAGTAVLSIGLPALLGNLEPLWLSLPVTAAVFFLFFKFLTKQSLFVINIRTFIQCFEQSRIFMIFGFH